ncbi:hypothetical protein VBM87_00595 [Mycoplasma sp. 744]|uniref:hypothetical protein n=1 Tax=unclassified Mycoplasma TaxID=2683645 RepID=UPI00211CDE9C|nr:MULTISPECIES: hypothetical protein [unclassified Mycoplasma]MEA4115284.1 hypothetical protein [Mycoplasma sp. 744]UUM19287.1 hypothetical protein NPA14_00195 [Mycoplasma sp. 1018B]
MDQKQNEILDLFIDVLSSTPGVARIIKKDLNKYNYFNDINVEYNNGVWNFTVSLIILENANCKDILTSISSLLNYKLKMNKMKLGKLNIFIEGINND